MANKRISDLPDGGTVTTTDQIPINRGGVNYRLAGFNTMALQSSSNVSITGGAISGITDLAVADGGTGASSASDARTNLGLVIGTNVQAYDADLAAIAALASTGLIAHTGAGTAAERTITAGIALAVTNGSGVSGDPTVALDIPSLTEDASPDAANDFVVTYDASATTHKKVKITNISGSALTAATQSDQETATSTSTYVSPGRQQYHPAAAKAWLQLRHSGGTPTIDSSYNVTSLTDVATGRVGVNLTTNFSSANYAISVTGEYSSGSYQLQGYIDTAATTSSSSVIKVNFGNSASGLLDLTSRASVIAYGDQ